MKIKELKIENIGGIRKLSLENFDPQMNIICGPNGIGKTTIIDCIAHIFTLGFSEFIKRNVNSESGSFEYVVQTYKNTYETNIININSYKPLEKDNFIGIIQHSKKIIHLRTNRTFSYENLHAIAKDDGVDLHTSAEQSMSGIYHSRSKSWFINKFVFSHIPNSLKEEQIHNFEVAKKCFSMLSEDFSFKTVDSDSLEIIVNTPSGDIVYEYLSSGFKSIILILFGIIREIELRFQDKRMKVEDFDGIVLIDEIDLHLHPEWQGKVSGILKQVFPNVQFILTTHSPHVIQTALKGEVIALERDGSDIKQRNLLDQEYGYLGWTIEEILEDIMGMPDLRTKKYNEVKNRFDNALDKKDKEKALEAYNELDKLLHPNYPLRPVFKIQLDSLGE